jgi:hypothetical protein
MKLIPLPEDENARMVLEPARGFDLGAGAGKRVETEVKGGTVGVILDGRGRPLKLPEDGRESQARMKAWVAALRLY